MLKRYLQIAILFGLIFTTARCTQNGAESPTETETAHSETDNQHEEHDDLDHGEDMLTLPHLEPINRNDGQLKVVATTSIIGDVVAQVGRDAIALTTLIEPGQDPHSFEPAAQDLTAVSQADLIIVNGWGLEEALIHDLEEISEGAPVIPISANITPLIFGANAEHEGHENETHNDNDEKEDGHAHKGPDPHVWMNIDNVKQWVNNTQQLLTQLDPANEVTYEQNAAAYLAELDTLAEYAHTQLNPIPAEKRFFVTNHDAFAYFGDAYNFTILGTVIPGISTMAEPSAIDLAELITEMEHHNICTIFTETTVSDSLAQTVAAELNNCDQVTIAKLYSGAIGTTDSDTNSYLKMMRVNIDTIANSLADQ